LDPGADPETPAVTDPSADPSADPQDGGALEHVAAGEARPQVPGQENPADHRGRGLKKSVADMLRSLAVIAGIVAVLVLVVPRPNSVPLVAVDVVATAEGAAKTLGWQPAIPQNLPAGWKATNAYVNNSGEGILTWHIGYLTADGHYASLEQAAKVTARWEEILTSGGTSRQPQTIDGTIWEQKYKDVRDVYALIHRGPGRTTMVTSKAGGLQNAEILARSLPVQLR